MPALLLKLKLDVRLTIRENSMGEDDMRASGAKNYSSKEKESKQEEGLG